MSNIGVIGLGAMGSGMAKSLRRAGHAVHVCDARPGAAEAFAREGGVACATPAEVGRSCQVVVSVVVNAQQTEAVLFGPEGAAADGAESRIGNGTAQEEQFCAWADLNIRGRQRAGP